MNKIIIFLIIFSIYSNSQEVSKYDSLQICILEDTIKYWIEPQQLLKSGYFKEYAPDSNYVYYWKADKSKIILNIYANIIRKVEETPVPLGIVIASNDTSVIKEIESLKNKLHEDFYILKEKGELSFIDFTKNIRHQIDEYRNMWSVHTRKIDYKFFSSSEWQNYKPFHFNQKIDSLLNTIAPTTKYGLKINDYTRVKNESKTGGMLDFERDLSKDGKSHYIMKEHSVWYTQEQMAILQWALFVKKLGVTNKDSLFALYKDLYGVNIEPGIKRALIHGLQGYPDKNK